MKTSAHLLAILLATPLMAAIEDCAATCANSATAVAFNAAESNTDKKSSPAKPASPTPQPTGKERERQNRRPRPEHWFL
jgi:hypothetical protein